MLSLPSMCWMEQHQGEKDKESHCVCVCVCVRPELQGRLPVTSQAEKNEAMRHTNMHTDKKGLCLLKFLLQLICSASSKRSPSSHTLTEEQVVTHTHTLQVLL